MFLRRVIYRIVDRENIINKNQDFLMGHFNHKTTGKKNDICKKMSVHIYLLIVVTTGFVIQLIIDITIFIRNN